MAPVQKYKQQLLSVNYHDYKAVKKLYREVEIANSNRQSDRNPSLYFTYCGVTYLKSAGRTNYVNLDSRIKDPSTVCRGVPRLDAD